MTTTWGHPEDVGGSGPTVADVLAWAKTRRAEPAVGPSEPSGVGSANVAQMYVVWLDDPSGKYGDHKGFFAYGDDAADAERNALKSRPGSTIKHPTQSTRQRRDEHSLQPSSDEPDLAELTHQMCALTKGKYDPVCTHTPAEVLQRGVSEIQRLRSHVDELVVRINRADTLAGEWDQSGADMAGRRAAHQLRAALKVAW